MSAPENTTSRDPFVHLLGAMSDGTSRYITDMESAGQQELVSSDTLPTEGSWVELEELGVIPGEVVDGDPLFRHCALPEGWTREGTEHAMHSQILDKRGVPRISVFYKAAFYDRRANVSVPDVGYSLSSAAIYGEGPAALPDLWSVLTEDERASFVDGLNSNLTRAEECPQVYAGRVPKVRAILALAQS